MSGRGLPGFSTEDLADTRIFQFGAKVRTLRLATVPLDMFDTATGISPATTFAREYLAAQPSNVGVLLIPAAYGGTGFTSTPNTPTWSVGAASSPEYDLPAKAVSQAVAGMAAARAAGYVVVLQGVLWHQGENNSSTSTAAYSVMLDKLISTLRTGLAAPSLPFVVGRMAPEGIAATPGRMNVDRAHFETPSRVAGTGFAPSTTGGINVGDTTHLSRKGVEYLGRTYLDAFKQATSPPPTSLSGSAPTIIDGSKVGVRLTAFPGIWGPAPVSLTYQWFRSNVAVSGATGATYTPGSTELDRTITVKVTGIKAGYAAVSRISPGVKISTPGTLTSATPAIFGAAKVGAPLTAVPGSWGPGLVTLSYQWYRSHIEVSGATGPTYTPGGAELGRTITVKVSGTKSGYSTISRTSSGVKIITPGTLTPAIPVISGAARVGAKLTVAAGSWGPAPVSLSYQWYRSQVKISGATGVTYTPSGSDSGRTITAKVTGAKAGYSTVTRTSAGLKISLSGTLASAGAGY